MSFHLSPGTHTFSVPWHSNGPGKDHLVINVESGGQNCVLLYTKMTNYEVVPYESLNSQIEEVPCLQAQREGAHLKPIEVKRVDPAVRAELDPASIFPGTSEAQH